MSATMKKKQRIIMPLKYVKKSLAYLDLKYTAKELPKGECTQLGLLSDGFDHININTYATGTVVVQPHGDPEAILLASYFSLRAKKLLRKGKIQAR